MANWTVLGTSTTDSPKSFGLTLNTDAREWKVGGPSVNNFFKTKSGKYIIKPAPELGVHLLKTNGEVVALFRGLTDASTVGATGSGNLYETAGNFTWKLESK